MDICQLPTSIKKELDKESSSKDLVSPRGKIKKENTFNIDNLLCEELRELLNDGLLDFADE